MITSSSKFWYPWIRCNGKGPRTHKNEKKLILFNIIDSNFKCFYQILSLFDMYMDIDEKIAWKQDGHIFYN